METQVSATDKQGLLCGDDTADSSLLFRLWRLDHTRALVYQLNWIVSPHKSPLFIMWTDMIYKREISNMSSSHKSPCLSVELTCVSTHEPLCIMWTELRLRTRALVNQLNWIVSPHTSPCNPLKKEKWDLKTRLKLKSPTPYTLDPKLKHCKLK